MPERVRLVGRAALLAVGIAVLPMGGPVAQALGAEPAVSIPIPGGRLVVAQHGAVTILALSQSHHTSSGKLPPDEMISGGTLESARLIGLPRPGVVLIETTYASQTGIGGPQVQCAAGQESILRVVALAPRPRQQAEMRVVSCWSDIYGTSMTWLASTATLVIEGISDMPSAYVIDEENHFRQVPAPKPGADSKAKLFDLP